MTNSRRGAEVKVVEHISTIVLVIWVKIQKSLIGGEKDLYLGTVYFSPRGNREMVSKIFENLSAEITYFERKGCVILLQGDLNTHVLNESDVLIQDKFDNDFNSDNILSLPPRTSEDSTKVDGRGEELLELCKAFNLVIINGRKTDDQFGKITSYQWRKISGG